MRSFVKIKSSRYGEITFSFTDLSKSCPSHESFTPQIRLLTLFAKIKHSRKLPNLQYFQGDEEISFRDIRRLVHYFQGSREHRPPWGCLTYNGI